ncbi:MAG: serine hydrolase [Bacteroidetes bacterium]|nr:serine hydrolase [Bacteroidota bacterium]
MYVYARLALFMAIVPGSVFAQKRSGLQRQVEQLVSGFNGTVGVYVINLRTGETASVLADSIFPTASMIKVPILIGIMNKLATGALTYHQQLLYRDSLLYPGEDILGAFRDSQRIELSKVIMLMLTMSDNTASLWLQSLAGGGAVINEKLKELGFAATRVNSRVAGRDSSQRLFGWGQTSPREMATIFQKIWQGQIISQAASEQMLRLLSRDYWDEEAISQVPPGIFIAAKSGAVDASRSETLLVAAPHGTYIFSVITRNQQDTSWHPENEGWVMERKLSRLLWDHFEPRSKWKPYLTVDGEPAR